MLVQLGELSSVRQALEGAALAEGDRHTLNVLTDANRRPRVLRDPIPPSAVVQVGHGQTIDDVSGNLDVANQRGTVAP